MADKAAGKALLFRSIGLLVFVQAREETRQWSVCHIPVSAAGGYQWSSCTPWLAVVQDGTLSVSPSVLDKSQKFNPHWHNAGQWSVDFVDGDQVDISEVGHVDACKNMNAAAFEGWQYVE